jgi:hypothetical protein
MVRTKNQAPLARIIHQPFNCFSSI